MRAAEQSRRNNINASGTVNEANADKVEVTPYRGETAGTMVKAEVRDGLFTARAVALADNPMEGVHARVR